MRRTRILIGAMAAVTAAAIALLGGVLDEAGPAAGGAARPAPVSSERALSGFSLGDTAATVLRLQQDVRARAGDQRSLALLGLAYLQRARETADSSYYARADGVLRRARALDRDDPVALSGLASLAASRHDFRASLGLARRTVALAPDTSRGYGFLGDALLELGRYDEAFRAFDRQVALKPSLSGYARIAYARELLGRPRQAIEAMELALDASGGLREPTAWTLVELGKLHFGLGELVEAGRSYRLALAAFPGYPSALDGLARVEAARGRLGRALTLQRRAVETIPLPHLVAQLGDLLAAAGRGAEAREQYALVAAIDRLQAANGVRTDLETALFRVDHGIRLGETVALARKARAERPSILGDDALAWALARNGSCTEALAWSKRSLRLGTRDASFFFHRGMIERCLGRHGRGTWLVRPCACDQPALLAPLEPDRPEVRLVKRLLLAAAVLAALAVPAAAAAHPLGNFTVNRYSEIELSGGTVYVHYALDLAEIPTFQLGDRVRSPRFAAEAARSLDLRLDGKRVPLRVLERRVGSRTGAGGLKTLRFDAVYAASGSGSRLTFEDRNFGSRIGWREIVVRAEEGAVLGAASVPAKSESDALRTYPSELLRSPLDVTSATASFTLGSGPGSPPALDERAAAAAQHERGGFEALVSRGDLSLGVILLSLLIAAFWGAAHALTPGHGKAIVAGYLVGTKGRPRDAVLLGAIVTVTHTIGVFALGFVTLLLSQFIVPEALYPWLTLASGVLVVGVGASVLWSRARRRGHHHHHTHDHHHGHHHHGHDQIDRRGLLGVGVAAGLLPCPSALVVLLSAIALHRIGFGLALILAFSVGLAATITTIGLIAVLAKRAFSRLTLDGPLVRLLPAASALVILAVGVGITLKALPEVL